MKSYKVEMNVKSCLLNTVFFVVFFFSFTFKEFLFTPHIRRNMKGGRGM